MKKVRLKFEAIRYLGLKIICAYPPGEEFRNLGVRNNNNNNNNNNNVGLSLTVQ